MPGPGKRRRFGLVALLIVCLGIAAVIVVLRLLRDIEDADDYVRRARSRAEIERMMLALMEYFNEFSDYPPGGMDLDDDGDLDDAGEDLRPRRWRRGAPQGRRLVAGGDRHEFALSTFSPLHNSPGSTASNSSALNTCRIGICGMEASPSPIHRGSTRPGRPTTRNGALPHICQHRTSGSITGTMPPT